ncbi:MAG: hypothetical protein LBU19_07015 [Treponema sp.]|jgi:hypothetical protein|nr:hypothetical protein [Treponema sp.]
MRFLALPLLFYSVCLGALDFREIHADFTIKPEYHRSFGFCQEFAAAGESLIGDSYGVQGGIALGKTGEEFDFDLFLGGSYFLPLPVKLRVRFLYIYNTIPAYTYQTNTLFPSLSYQGKWGGVELGTAFRFTVFASEFPAIFEPVLGGRLFLNFPFFKKVKLAAGFGNLSAFNVGNLGAYFLFVESRIDINEVRPQGNSAPGVPLVSLISNLEIYQTGSIALTAAFQGFAWQGGIRFSW